MKGMYLALLGTAVCLASLAQTDTTGKPTGTDTIKVGNMIIIKKHDGKEKADQPGEKKETDREVQIEIKKRKSHKPSNVSTNWWILDLGFANVNDQTDYASAAVTGPGGYFPGGSRNEMSLRNGKSVNVNIWFFQQRVNMIKHVVNLQYGLGVELNNYRFEKNVRFRYDPADFIERDPLVASYRKNKLAADYVTLPVMLNFNFTPQKKNGYGFSAGVSAGYLYSARQKLVSGENGKEKIRNDFNLQPWKLSAIGELNLGAARLYGSYALNNMFRSGLDQTPYTVGLRLSSW
ncbi:MAG TPA: outer membrane beta-barrel protein [Lacibacter sp.]|nr:outer membrane beta-barrel protein [Lacibacter sp.]HMO88138.1 outer membrane beta-barrel protein [Lacibacter sp.]HMP86511.1 outer membrane beta-barrel protein [Lacibacter sp.]